ncbi:serine/threonine-protein phosphatase [Curtobacterium sp. Csp1]|uniref:PP2C family protein-serine/threonine phosphatase n=1 Tax=Curtobacterium sp. Csp1 TaxID=2495429 RepID=UPI00159B6DE6|nr:PP2C family protein-serine/threonine phosphatase [Curtobacterium sp. Csp1]QKS21754.1 serine/threonine-protein phosphatase [Curtobacterium sp. Csp1]
MTSTTDRNGVTSWTTSVRDDTGPIVLTGVRASWEPLVKQTVVAVLVVGAAVASVLTPWLEVTDAPLMWAAVGLVLVGLLGGGLMARWPAVTRVELVLPALDFLAVGLLRYGTGEARSVFLAIVVLPVIWMATNPGRRHVVYPLLGTAATLLLPYVLDPEAPQPSELVRLVVALLVYAAAAAVTNELARRADLQLSAVQRKRRVAEGEIDRAALVQRSLRRAAGAVGVCLPSRTVGGDFYDWFPTGEGAAFTLGDVMGKGVGAGMIAAAVRSLIRSTVDETDSGLATGGSDLTSGQFTTCRDGHARWVDAGHGLTVLRRAGGSVHPLRAGHLPIGVGTMWTADTTSLDPGDVVVAVSDGVLDLFGGDLDALDRFETWVASRSHAQEIVDGIAELAASGDHPDDVTVLCVAYRP